MGVPWRVAAGSCAAAVLLTASACSGEQGSKEEFCAQVRKVPALESVLSRFSETDPDVLADRIAKARTAYEDLAEAAPAKIEEATAEVVELVDAILTAVEEHPTDPAKASAQLRKEMEDHAGAADARAEVTAYAQDECDVQLDATLTDAPGASTTTTAPSSTDTTEATTTTTG